MRKPREVKIERGRWLIITHYGYTDGSGEYYVVIDTEKCNGCSKCVDICPQSALELCTLLIDLEDKTVAAVKEDHRKKIKYTCSPCKPDSQKTPCSSSCEQEAICCFWKTR